MTKDDGLELEVLRKVVGRFLYADIAVHDEQDPWGWRNLRLKDAIKSELAKVGLKNRWEAL